MTSSGTLEYKEHGRLVLRVEQSFADYYLSLVPKHLRVHRQGWPAHITVIRPGTDIVIGDWPGVDNGKPITFVYATEIRFGQGFAWLDCWSLELEAIRSKYHLVNTSSNPKLPAGYAKTFHCTIGRYDYGLDQGERPEE